MWTRLARDVYACTADLLHLEVDLLFFDTTSICFETEAGAEPIWRDAKGHPTATNEREEEAVPDTGGEDTAERSGSAEAAAALGQASRYQDVAGNMRIREVRSARTNGSWSATTPRPPIDRGWHDMEQILDLRPLHHRLEDRLRIPAGEGPHARP